MDKTQQFDITPEEAGGRIDAVLAARETEGLSRSRLKALIREGALTQNEVAVRDPSRKVKADELYVLRIPQTKPVSLVPVDIALDILYEDDDLLVINKPAGLTVHPGAGNHDHTLVHALLAHCGDSLSGIGGEARPGIVHRLDKDTSGLIVVAKHDHAHQGLSAQLSDRTLSRRYQALIWGTPQPPKGSIEGAIGRSPRNRKKMAVLAHGGKEATTHYECHHTWRTHPTDRQASQPLVSLVACKLETGRTHQIRVHMTHAGYPLIGDPLYGGRSVSRMAQYTEEQCPAVMRKALEVFPRQALHAAEIGFVHPISKEKHTFRCNLPDDMAELIDNLHAHLHD